MVPAELKLATPPGDRGTDDVRMPRATSSNRSSVRDDGSKTTTAPRAAASLARSRAAGDNRSMKNNRARSKCGRTSAAPRSVTAR